MTFSLAARQRGMFKMAEIWKERQFEILKQISAVCISEGIGMQLAGETALSAYRDGKLNDFPVISIDVCDAYRFIRAIEKVSEEAEDGRIALATEGIHNNPRHAVFSAEVYDPATTDFNAGNFFNYLNNCLHVRVEYRHCRKANPLIRVIASQKVKAWKASDGSRPDQGMEALKWLGKEHGRGSLKSGSSVDIGSLKFGIPEDTEAVLEESFGHYWRSFGIRQYCESTGRFRDTEYSWEEYKKRIQDFDTGEYIRIRKEYKPLNCRYMKLRDTVDGYHDILKRTHARFLMYQRYKGVGDEIISLVQQGDTRKAGELLAPYISEMKRFAEKGLGLCFDPALFEAAVSVMKADGEGEAAERIAALVPEEHRKKLVIKDYR